MKRKYLNLDVFNGIVKFEDIEFKKDDTEPNKNFLLGSVIK